MTTKEVIDLGIWTESELDVFIRSSFSIKNLGDRINFISKEFLGVDYKESTLIGDVDTPEVFVINLKGVDCFTFLDYVEAMRISNSFLGFKESLKKVRYRSGLIEFNHRNHFFTDWIEFNADFVTDISEQIGGHNAVSIKKNLNLKDDGSFFLIGIQPRKREIRYIPTAFIDSLFIDKLETGDYAGIYSNKKGLDVSHVGIIIKDNNKIYFRHASSLERRVIDEDFMRYIMDKHGIIILRPKD